VYPPVDVGPPLLHHGLLTQQHLAGVQDVEEVHGHEEGDGDVPPHGVRHGVLGVDRDVLRGGVGTLKQRGDRVRMITVPSIEI